MMRPNGVEKQVRPKQGWEYSYDFRNKTLAEIQTDGYTISDGTAKLNSNGISSQSRLMIARLQLVNQLTDATKLTITQNCILSSGTDSIRLFSSSDNYQTGVYMDDSQNTRRGCAGGSVYYPSSGAGITAGTYTQKIVIDLVNKTAELSCTGKPNNTTSITDTDIYNVKNNLTQCMVYIYGSNCYIGDFTIKAEY